MIYAECCMHSLLACSVKLHLTRAALRQCLPIPRYNPCPQTYRQTYIQTEPIAVSAFIDGSHYISSRISICIGYTQFDI